MRFIPVSVGELRRNYCLRKIIYASCIVAVLFSVATNVLYFIDPGFNPRITPNMSFVPSSYLTCNSTEMELRRLRNQLSSYEMLINMTEYQSWGEEQLRGHSAKLLIVSGGASGMSLVGELYNRHPDVFYMHQPLRSLDFYRANRPDEVYEEMALDLIEGVLQCRFDHVAYLASYYSFKYSAIKSRMMSQALSEPPLCPSSTNIRSCLPLTPSTLRTICRTRKHVVLGSTQLTDIVRFYGMASNEVSVKDLVQPKILHVVRDPRAVVFETWRAMNQSREARAAAESDVEWVTRIAAELCGSFVSDLRFANSAMSHLASRYAALRVEDLYWASQHTLLLLDRFTGIHLTSKVRLWLERQLSGINYGRSAPAFGDGRFETKRFLFAWRNEFPVSLITQVESECAEVMNAVGYVRVGNNSVLPSLDESLLR